jgi:heme A synthase
MQRKFRHIIASATAVCALGAVVTGARLTSAKSLPFSSSEPWNYVHRGLSTSAALGALFVGFSVTGPLRLWLLGSVLLTAIPGGLLETKAIPALAAPLHAVAASLLTSICAVATLQLSSGWIGEANTIPDEGSPSLPALARATWGALLFQTALGALYRHQIVGLLPHIIGAMLVMGMVMYAGIAAISTEHATPAIKRPALVLLVIVGVQMLTGLGAYLYRLEFREQATGQSAMITFTVTHVAVGALTTACSALMGMQILRYVRPGAVGRQVVQ